MNWRLLPVRSKTLMSDYETHSQQIITDRNLIRVEYAFLRRR